MTTKQNASSKDDPTFPEFLGTMAAHLQHGVDLAAEWVLKAVREKGESPAPKEAGRVARAGRGFLKILGQFGDSYYGKYEELKRKRS